MAREIRHPRPEKMIEEIAADAAEILGLLEEAAAVQYERPIRHRGKTIGGTPTKGEPSRPTEDTTLDPIRLALREEVKRSARLLVQTHHDFDRARYRLLGALERWQGE